MSKQFNRAERDAIYSVILAPDDGTVFGRRTMPEEMALCSVSCAIENMWLASRAENLGMGWVSFFKPADVASLLRCPKGSKPIALLCLGPVKAFYDKPMLKTEGWRSREPMAVVLGENQYPLATDTPEHPLLRKRNSPCERR